jgi:hypothetical protein
VEDLVAMKKLLTICVVLVPVAMSGSRVGRMGDAQLEARSSATGQGSKNGAMPTAITYHQLYVTPDGETHFREIRVPLTTETTAPPAEPIAQSALQPATSIRHAAFPAHWGVNDRDHRVFHNASAARFISVRQGVAWVTASDGETRRFQTGDVFEVLDVAPSKGHITWVGDEPVIMLFSNHP